MTIDKAASGVLPEPPEATVSASQRERLLTAAVDLFYRHGVGVGANALCKSAGISKKSMYQLFDSKDALLVAALERRVLADAAFLLPPPDFGPGPRARLLHVFRQLEKFARSPEYMGCAFLAPQVELKDPAHPASLVAARVKRQHLEGFFRTEAERGKATDPDFLTRQLAILYDGASTRAGIGADDLQGLAVTTAETLIEAAGITD
ncbi:TetR/AcrR family transcriptional regulator [Streptomyces odonnellii]|uniref:TetR/AcrR family transcriptional regulator n=1 Tax=Streptomyces odonnellii TaxID=1417980 RepID=UPI00099E122E|nr:TetR/AcrR family transcriptional regulator [Streptomyces odonnellii]